MRFDVRDALAKFAQKATANPAILNPEPSLIGLAFRTDSTAPLQACTLIGAAAMPEIDGNRQHTMRAVPIGAGGSVPDVRQGALGGRRARLDVVTSGSGSGRAYPACQRTQGRWIPRISRVTTLV